MFPLSWAAVHKKILYRMKFYSRKKTVAFTFQFINVTLCYSSAEAYDSVTIVCFLISLDFTYKNYKLSTVM